MEKMVCQDCTFWSKNKCVASGYIGVEPAECPPDGMICESFVYAD